MHKIEIPYGVINKISFNHRAEPVPANLRPIFRISIILLVLKINCKNQSASLLKIQFFNWVLKSESLQKFIKVKGSYNSIFSIDIIHLDPMVNLSLKYAIAEGLITTTDNLKYKLTDKGNEFIKKIIESDDRILSSVIEILDFIGKRVSEVKLKGELL